MPLIYFNRIAKALVQLKNILQEEGDEVKTAAAWTIGQIGRHSASHADAVSKIGLLPIILAYYLNAEVTEGLKEKVRPVFITGDVVQTMS